MRKNTINVVLRQDISENTLCYSIQPPDISEKKVLVVALCERFEASEGIVTALNVEKILINLKVSSEDASQWKDILCNPDRQVLLSMVVEILKSFLSTVAEDVSPQPHCKDFPLCLETIYYFTLTAWHIERQATQAEGIAGSGGSNSSRTSPDQNIHSGRTSTHL